MTPQEAQIQALIIQAKAIETEVIGMKLHDDQAIKNNDGTYLESLYTEKAYLLYGISSEIQGIAGSGL